jgi:hypothetical protein
MDQTYGFYGTMILNYCRGFRRDLWISLYTRRSRTLVLLLTKAVDVTGAFCVHVTFQLQVNWFIRNKLFWEELVAYFPFTTIWVFDTTVCEPVILVLLMKGFYEVRRWDGLRWHDIHTKFHTDWFRHLRYYLNNFRGCNVGITVERGLRSTPLRWHYIHDN